MEKKICGMRQDEVENGGQLIFTYIGRIIKAAIISFFILMILMMMDNLKIGSSSVGTGSETINMIILFTILLIPFPIMIFISFSEARARMNAGVHWFFKRPLDGYVWAEDVETPQEENAVVNEPVSQNTNNNTIEYWFDLYQKGAITEDEYNAKKKELL